MEQKSEEENRALNARCRLPTSPASRTAVIRLRALPPDLQALCIVSYAHCNLPHLVRCALEAGIAADTRWGEDDDPVLCVAAQNGSERALKALLDGRANHALVNNKGMTAAHEAAFHGRIACLRLLVDAGAQLEAKMNGGFTPLHCAAQDGHAECCSLLLASGCNANAHTMRSGDTALMLATVQKHFLCLRALLPASDLGARTISGHNIFHVSLMTGNLECFELLLPLISDVDVRTVAGVRPDDGSPVPNFNVTPLNLACSFGQERMVKALLSRGASRTACDSVLRTPLHEASRNGHLGCVRQLLGKPGAYKLTPDEVNAADVYGWTALHLAATEGHTKLCGLLCAGGARLDAVNQTGGTPLMAAQLYHPSNTALLDLLAGRGPAHAPGTVCDECGVPETEAYLRSCTGCLVARFCGDVCLRAAWPAHRAECQRIQAARETRCRGQAIEQA